MADMNIALSITAKDVASPTVDKVNSSVQKLGNQKGVVDELGDSLQGAIGPSVAAAAAAGVLAAGAMVAQFVSDSMAEFAAFETGMAEVFTLLPGLSEESMGALEMQALDAAASMGRLPEEVIPALYQALSAGVPPDNVFEFLETANQAAIGGVTDLETAVDSISSVTNAYGLEVLDAAEASDLMFTAVRLGTTTFDELGASLFQVVPTAAALGVGFGDITAALAVMAAQGVPTSVATTQLRQALVELSKEGSAAADTFERAAGVSFAQFIAQGGNLQQALAIMASEAGAANIPVSNLFGSVEAGNAALALTGGNAQKFIDAIDQMGDSAGATATAAGEFEGTMQRLEDTVAAQTAELKILIAQGLAPTKKAWLELNQVILDGAIAAAKNAQARREAFDTWEEERDVQGDVIAQLSEYIAANEVAIETSRGFVDEQEAIWEALDTVNAAFDPYNGSVQDSTDNTAALTAMLQLLEDGFTGTGAELGAAAIQLVEYQNRVINASSATDGWMAGVRGSQQALADQRQAIIDSQPPIDGHVAALLNSQAAAEAAAGGATTHADAVNAQAEAVAAATARMAGYFVQAVQATDAVGFYATAIDEAGVVVVEATANEEALNQAMFEQLQQAGAGPAALAAYGVATGLWSEEQAEAALKSAILQEAMAQLAAQYVSGELSLAGLRAEMGNLVADVNALDIDIGESTGQIDIYADSITNAGAAALAATGTVSGLGVAAEDAAGTYDIIFNVTTNGDIPSSSDNAGYGGSGGAGNQAPPDGWALGGYTGDGSATEIAGVVHRGEYVVPPNIVDHWGVDGIENLLSGAAAAPARIETREVAGGGGGQSPVMIDMRGSSFFGLDDFEAKLESIAARVMGRYGNDANMRLLTR